MLIVQWKERVPGYTSRESFMEVYMVVQRGDSAPEGAQESNSGAYHPQRLAVGEFSHLPEGVMMMLYSERRDNGDFQKKF